MHSKCLLTFGRTQTLFNLINHNENLLAETKRCIYIGQKRLKDDIKGDWMGPPHPVSNLLTMKLHIPENESIVERQYREERIEVQRWNQEFWEKHNTNFYKLQKQFVKKTLEEKYLNEPFRTTLPGMV
uniref:APOPT family protein CG14806, mitochondrial n=1 Tax=Strigamia maritima TaxID=126957 RepID=T1J0T9_STRMM